MVLFCHIRFLIHLFLSDDSHHLQMVFGDVSIFIGGFRIYIIFISAVFTGLAALIVLTFYLNFYDNEWIEVIQFLKENSLPETISLNSNKLASKLKYYSKLILGICKIISFDINYTSNFVVITTFFPNEISALFYEMSTDHVIIKIKRLIFP